MAPGLTSLTRSPSSLTRRTPLTAPGAAAGVSVWPSTSTAGRTTCPAGVPPTEPRLPGHRAPAPRALSAPGQTETPEKALTLMTARLRGRQSGRQSELGTSFVSRRKTVTTSGVATGGASGSRAHPDPPNIVFRTTRFRRILILALQCRPSRTCTGSLIRLTSSRWSRALFLWRRHWSLH